MTIEEAKKWYESFKQQLKDAGYALDNPYAMGLVQVLGEVPEIPGPEDSTETKVSFIHKVNGMDTFAFMKKDSGGKYVTPMEPGTVQAQWLMDNMQNPEELQDEDILKLAELAQQHKLFLKSPLKEAMEKKTGQFITVTQDGLCHFSVPLKTLSKDKEKKALISDGFSEQEAEKCAEDRSVRREAYAEAIKVMELQLDDIAQDDNEPDYTEEDQQALRKETQKSNIDTMLCVMGANDSTWMNTEEKREKNTELIRLITMDTAERTLEENIKVRENPIVSIECEYITDSLIKKFNPQKDPVTHKRIIEKNLKSIMESGLVTRTDGSAYPTDDTYTFINEMVRDVIDGKGCKIRETVNGKETQTIYASEADMGLKPAMNTMDYKVRLNYILNRWDQVSKGDNGDTVKNFRQLLSENVDALSDSELEYMSAHNMYIDMEATLGFAERITRLYQEKGELTLQEQKELIVLSRLRLTCTELYQNVPNPALDLNRQLAEKIAGNVAMKFMAGSGLLEDAEGNPVTSRGFGHHLLTSPAAMQEYTEKILHSKAFTSMIAGQNQKNLEKMLKSPGEDIAKAFLTLEKNPVLPQSTIPADTTGAQLGGITVTKEMSEKLKENAVSELLRFDEAKDGKTKISFRLPEKTTAYIDDQAKNIEFRKNANRLLKYMAKQCFDENGQLSYKKFKTMHEKIQSAYRSDFDDLGPELCEVLHIPEKQKQEFAEFVNLYQSTVVSVLQTCLTEQVSELHTYQTQLEEYQSSNPKNPEQGKVLLESYRDFEQAIRNLEKTADMDAEKEQQVFIKINDMSLNSILGTIVPQVNRYAETKNLEPMKHQSVKLSYGDVKDDPPHHLYRRTISQICETFKIPMKNGAEYMLSMEPQDFHSGKLMKQETKTGPAIGIFADQESFRKSHLEQSLTEIDHVQALKQAREFSRTMKDKLHTADKITGFYEMSINSRKDLRKTAHTYKSLAQRLSSSDVDSTWIRSKEKFRNAKATFEKLGNAKDETKREELLLKLQDEAKQYLEYKDPKGSAAAEKDLSQYAKNRIEFMRDVYEYTSVHLNRRNDLKLELAQKLISQRISNLEAEKKNQQSQAKAAELKNPEKFIAASKELLKNEKFRNMTRGIGDKALREMCGMKPDQLSMKLKRILEEPQKTADVVKIQ